MGAANLDKMVEKNRDLLECVGGEILEMYVLERRKEMERWLDIGLENHEPVPKAARAGPHL